MEKQLRIGISLQILFIFMFFAALLPGKIYGAIFALSISLYSLYSGVQSYRHQYKPALARVVIAVGILLLAFTLFAYFTEEGGMPAEVMRF